MLLWAPIPPIILPKTAIVPIAPGIPKPNGIWANVANILVTAVIIDLTAITVATAPNAPKAAPKAIVAPLDSEINAAILANILTMGANNAPIVCNDVLNCSIEAFSFSDAVA